LSIVTSFESGKRILQVIRQKFLLLHTIFETQSFLQLLVAHHVSKVCKSVKKRKNFVLGAALWIRALSISENVLGDLGLILEK